MNSLNHAMRVSATGLHAERFRMNTISENIANANSVAPPGQPSYQRQVVELAGGADGVRVTRVTRDTSPDRAVYEPGNPFSDSKGFVHYSNVDPIKEMVNMLSAGRAYEANIAAFNSAKSMVRAALQIGKV